MKALIKQVRKIRDVRREIRDLQSGIDHGVIRGDGICFREPEVVTIKEAQDRLAELQKDYPHWERTQLPKP